MNYDPNLKECMARIEELCKQYDCAAQVVLVSRNFAEVRAYCPEWSGMSDEIGPTGEVLGIHLKVGKHEREKAEGAAHVAHTAMEMHARAFFMFHGMVQEMDKKWKVEHSEVGFRPHRKGEN